MNLPEQPTLPYLLKQALKSLQLDLHTALPGIVQSYDAKTQTADIQPAIKRKKQVGEIFKVVNLPIITKVPVIFPRTQNAFIHFPLEKGDSVLLVFCERSLEQWRSLGGITDPKDARMHDLSDAVCLPGLFPNSNVASVHNPEAITLQNLLGKIEIFPDGKVTFGNGSIELIDLLVQLLQAIQSAVTATAIGPQPLVNPQFAAIQTQLELLKGG